jgi:hypothetical protein
MNKLLFITITFLACSLSPAAVFAQKKIAKKSTGQYSFLSDYKSIIERDGIMAGLWNLTGSESQIKASEFAPILVDSLKRGKQSKDLALIKNFSPLLQNYFNGIISFGEAGRSLILEHGNFPFFFATKDGQLTFIQNGVFSDYSLNSYKMDADERAEMVVKNILLPSLKNFEPLTKNAAIKFFVFDVGYRAKDFTNESSSGDGEMTSMTVPRALLIKYINADITDKQIMKLAVFFNSNKNSNSIRKISFD